MQPDLSFATERLYPSFYLYIYIHTHTHTQKEIERVTENWVGVGGQKEQNFDSPTRVRPVHLDFFIVPRQFGPRSSRSRPGRVHLGPCGFNASRQVFWQAVPGILSTRHNTVLLFPRLNGPCSLCGLGGSPPPPPSSSFHLPVLLLDPSSPPP